MARNQGGITAGDILLGFVVLLALGIWGLYELCYALIEVLE